MNVNFSGYGENVATFETNGTITVGSPVMVTANGKVSAANGAFCGICTGLRNGYAAVQLSGYARVAYTDAPSVGYSKISAASGKITADSDTGREYLIIDIDTTNKIAGIIL